MTTAELEATGIKVRTMNTSIGKDITEWTVVEIPVEEMRSLVVRTDGRGRVTVDLPGNYDVRLVYRTGLERGRVIATTIKSKRNTRRKGMPQRRRKTARRGGTR